MLMFIMSTKNSPVKLDSKELKGRIKYGVEEYCRTNISENFVKYSLDGLFLVWTAKARIKYEIEEH